MSKTLLSVLIVSAIVFAVQAYDQFDVGCVKAHKSYRELYGLDALAWSESLATDAQEWADYLAENDLMVHDNETMNSENQGENLAWFKPAKRRCKGPKKSTCVTCAEIVDDWYNQVQNYNFSTGGPKSPGLKINQFAQVVWKNSTEIGFGFAISAKYGFIGVMRYQPRGAVGSPINYMANIPEEVGVLTTAVTGGSVGTQPTSPSTLSPPTTMATNRIFPANDVPQKQGTYDDDYQPITCGLPAIPKASTKACQNQRIVGGVRAVEKEWPWQANFRWKGKYSQSNLFCGGSLIDKKWVLSAAHCFKSTSTTGYYQGQPEKLEVVLGNTKTKSNEPGEVNVDVDKIFKHEQYNPSTFDYDMALVRLKNPVTYSDYVKQICLPSSDKNFLDCTKGKNKCACIVTGFGVTSQGGSQPQDLMKVEVPIMTHEECAKDSQYGLTDRMICAGYKEGGKDACQGDSGGPLVCSWCNEKKWYLAGVVSYGYGCAMSGYPGVYADVKNLKGWIENTKSQNS